MPERYVLLGGNVADSPTPRMMNAAMKALGIDAIYEASSVGATELGKVVAALRESEVAGANVTIPHKTAIARFIDSLEGAAAQTGAVNTLKKEGEGYAGYNTDVDGILGPLASRGRTAIRRAAVVGTGGAARAFCMAMNALECSEITVISRDPSRAEDFISSMHAAFPSTRIEFASPEGARTCAPAILYNASPAGTGGIPLPAEVDWFLESRPLVFDAVYAPVETDLIRRARSRGCQVIYGHEMLLHQALRSLEIWTGMTPPLQVMRSELFSMLGVPAD